MRVRLRPELRRQAVRGASPRSVAMTETAEPLALVVAWKGMSFLACTREGTEDWSAEAYQSASASINCRLAQLPRWRELGEYSSHRAL